MPTLPFTYTLQQFGALMLPPLLIASMLAIFKAFHRRFGHPLGHLLAFIVYWIAWCLVIPTILLGGFDPLLALFNPMPSFSSLDWKTHLILWWPLLFPMLFMCLPRLKNANIAIVLISIVMGITIGLTEEILWRGVYIRLFADNLLLAVAYPTLMFAVWHLCPMSVLPNRLPGGKVSFIMYAYFLGLFYAAATLQTGSIAWSTIGHIIHDSLGLSGFTYAVLLTGQPVHKSIRLRVTAD